MTKTLSLVLTVIFTLFLSGFFILFFVLPDRINSEQENRELANIPDFSISELLFYNYTEKFETYISDQFPFRDEWITVKARCELMSGKKENKGVYLCEYDTLIEAYSEPDYKLLDTNIAAVRSLSENIGKPVFFALIPGKSQIYSSSLPKKTPNYSQGKVIDYCYERSGSENIDVFSPLMLHYDEYIFYRTDHHWTSLGAYYAYDSLMEAMGYNTTPLSAFCRNIISDEFYGTLYSKSGMTWVEPDRIEIIAQQEKSTHIVNYVSGQAEESTMYEYEYLDKKNKYAVFMGGISPLITITTENKDAPVLLVVRDSYMDSIAPFLQDNFSKIILMDLRYYKTQLMESSISEFIKDNEIDEVLVCYSVNNFAADNSVFLLGMSK